jgi:hypothetical protein
LLEPSRYRRKAGRGRSFAVLNLLRPAAHLHPLSLRHYQVDLGTDQTSNPVAPFRTYSAARAIIAKSSACNLTHQPDDVDNRKPGTCHHFRVTAQYIVAFVA